MIYPDTISGDLDRRASTSSMHVESAFPFAGSEPSTSSESHTGQALSIIYTPDNRRDLEEPGLGAGPAFLLKVVVELQLFVDYWLFAVGARGQ
jgi:hypothetical protein